jgi:hypothetical protein
MLHGYQKKGFRKMACCKLLKTKGRFALEWSRDATGRNEGAARTRVGQGKHKPNLAQYLPSVK